MWLLRDGRHIRVDLENDPCWSNNDIWKARNLYARFKSIGYSNDDCAIYASASVWKNKWVGTKYSKEVESTLSAIQLNTISQISTSS
jgi:hypothetical protein